MERFFAQVRYEQTGGAQLGPPAAAVHHAHGHGAGLVAVVRYEQMVRLLLFTMHIAMG
jgi:hypothetical protein